MDNELSIALAWACTATLSTLYYMSKVSKLRHICEACMLAFKHLAEGTATITTTKDGVRIRSNDETSN